MESNVIPSNIFDPELKAEPSQIFVSGRTETGRVAMVGLTGALPPSVRYQIYQEGTPHLLAEGLASNAGAFALWLNIDAPSVVIRALSADQTVWGPDISVPLQMNVPEERPVSVGLVSVSSPSPKTGKTGRVIGIGAAAPGRQDLIIGGIDTVDAIRVTPDKSGAFMAPIKGNHHDRVVLFVVGSPDKPVRSTPVEAEFAFGDFPVILTPRAANSPAPLAFFAPAGVLQPDSAVQVNSVSAGLLSSAVSTGQDGSVGSCLFELPLHDVMEVSGVGPQGETRIGRRMVHDSTRDVAVLTPYLEWHFSIDVGVWFDGTVSSSLAYLIAVDCNSGRARMEAVASDATVGLPLPAEAGDIIAVFGIDKDGYTSIPHFLRADTGQPIAVPLPSLVDDQIITSAVDSGRVLIAGVGSEDAEGPLAPYARLEVASAGGVVPVTDGGPEGNLAFVMDGVQAEETLVLTQLVGPFRSAPLPLQLQENDVQHQPPAPASGLIAVQADGMGRLRAQGYAGSVVGDSVFLANLRTGLTLSVPISSQGAVFQQELPGKPDDSIAILTQKNGQSSTFTLRKAALYDLPYVVSAADGRLCAAGPPGTADQVDSIQLKWEQIATPQGVPVFRGEDDSWISMTDETHFPNSGAHVSASGLSASAVLQSVPPMHTTSLKDLIVEGGLDGLRLSNGGEALSADWLIVVATPAGAVRFVRPPSEPAWTLPLSLPLFDHVLLFGVHLPTGHATGCHMHDVKVDPLPDPPFIESVTPTPLIVGKTFTVIGHALAGSSLTIGDVPQVSAVIDDNTLMGKIDHTTPLGAQVLRVETVAGAGEYAVEVIVEPTIKEIQPSPLIVGKNATIHGSGFGENPQVWIGGMLVPLEAVSDSLIEILVPAKLMAGTWNMTVYNGSATSQTAVVVECKSPELVALSPNPVMLGGLLSVNGDFLLDAKVWVNNQLQTKLSGTDVALTLTVAPQTPLGDGEVVIETGCGKVQGPLTVATSPPVIDQWAPSVAILGKPINIYGDHLAGAVVQLGGVVQTLTIDSKKGLAFVVEPTTPLGDQLLVVQALGGKGNAVLAVVAPPTIEWLDPKVIEVGGTLMIMGTHLAGGTVTVGGVEAPVLSSTSKKIVVKVGAATPGGGQSVLVSTLGGQATSTVEVVALPLMTSVDPNPLVRGQTAHVFGSNLMGASIFLGGESQTVETSAAGLVQWMVASDTPLGESTLQVVTVGGQVSMQVVVVEPPLIDEVTPAPLVSGQPFSIHGAGFGSDGLVVSISGVVQSVLESTQSSIQATLTPGTPLGEQTLVVETVFGSDAWTVQIVGPPKLVGANPDPVLAGQPLTVVGVGLMNSMIGVAGVVAEIVSLSPTSAVVIVPKQTPPGLQTVVVSTAFGDDSIEVMVVPLGPVLESVQPLPLMTGEEIVVTGNYLWNAAITISGTPVTIQSNTATQIVGIVPTDLMPGTGKPCVVSTTGGTTVVMVAVNDGSMTGAPHVTAVEPDALPVGGTLTIKGQYLWGATVLIGGIVQSISLNTMTTVTLTVSENAPVGLQTLQITTAEGTALTKVEVLPPSPLITQVSPNPVVVGANLEVTGDHFANLKTIQLGGVEQKLVSAFTNEQLVFQVMKGTPVGEAVPLVIQTLSGSASVVVGVTPAPVDPIEVLDVSPLLVGAGEVVTVSGVGLSDVSVSVGGVAQVLDGSSGDLLLTFSLAEDTPPGKQSLVLEKLGASSVALILSVRPPPPVSNLLYVSGLSAAGDVVFAALPGAFYPAATTFVTTEANLVIQAAHSDGSLGVVFENVDEGDVLSIKQAVDGIVSTALERTIMTPTAQSPLAPHAYLTRVEQQGTTVQVYGPSPAFGGDDTLIIVVKDGLVGHAMAQDLHADSSQGVVLNDVSSSSTPVWVLAFHPDETIPGSDPMATFGLNYDPPMLSSGLADGSFCLAGLAGTVPSGVASVTVSAGGWAVGPIGVGDEGGLFAQVSAKPGIAPPDTWSTSVGLFTTDGALQVDSVEALLASQVTVDGSVSGELSVSIAASDIGVGRLLVAVTNEGESEAAFVVDTAGTVNVKLEGGGDTLALWSVPLYEGSPSSCLLLPLN